MSGPQVIAAYQTRQRELGREKLLDLFVEAGATSKQGFREVSKLMTRMAK